MSAKRGCPECGASLSSNAPEGLCPRCLMGAGETGSMSVRGGPGVDLDGFRRAVLEVGLAGSTSLDLLAERAAGDLSGLARLLVKAGKLTPYQAEALMQGKARGLVIGPCLVLERRGQGGMGVVFKARHRESGRVVALKILLPSFGRDRDAVARFRREFEIAARIDHPNVVAALEASEDRGVQFLTMEYVEGHDLNELVKSVGPLPIKQALHCAIQAARGLAAAHALGIVHRDVKPGNLMLDKVGLVRVLDLGLARVIEATGALTMGAVTGLTRSGAYLGTADYLAPEQADDPKKATHRADIYALGCTIHHLLTGRPPFGRGTILQQLMAHQDEPAPSLLDARDDVPDPLEHIYLEMMAKRPDDRPGSMDEIVARLESCRASAAEAREARDGLMSFAETVLKRAAPRVKGRNPDASVFARRSDSGGLQFDPDIDLEDVITDFREEARVDALTEEQLPPVLPRSPVPRSRRRRGPGLKLLGAAGALAAGAAAFALIPRGGRDAGPAPPSKAAVPAATPVSPATPAFVPPVLASAPRTLRVFHEDDFDPPPGYWAASTPEDIARDPNHRRGTLGGVYFHEVRGGTYAFDAPDGPYPDFSCEVVARITGDNPASKGAVVLHVVGPDARAIQVRLDQAGAVFVAPSWASRAGWPSTPWIGPYFHPAIHRGGGAFNTVRLVVRRRRLEVFVNSARALPPLKFDWDLTPASIYVGADCKVPVVRAQYDRIEIKELPDEPAGAREPASELDKPLRVVDEGGVVMPDGTRIYEGAQLAATEVTGGRVAPQENMDEFPGGLWTNHRQLLWEGARVGNRLTLRIPLEESGNYEVQGRFTQAPGFGQCKLEIDGKPLAGDQVINLSSGIVKTTDLLPLGFVTITPRTAFLAVTIVGRNRSAPAVEFGLDELRLVPVR